METAIDQYQQMFLFSCIMGHKIATIPTPPNHTKAQVPLAAIYDRYAAALLGVILDIVGDQSEALTVLEHTFTQFYAQLSQAKPSKMPVFVQLLTLARSLATEARKRLKPGLAQALTDTGQAIALQIAPQDQELAPAHQLPQVRPNRSMPQVSS